MDTNKVLEIIAKQAKVDVNNLNDNTNFKTDLHLDSIDLFQIIMDIEETFNIKIENEQLLDIKTVGDAISKIKNAK